MNDTIKASPRRGRARVLAILASGALLGSALATAPIISGVAGAATPGGTLTAVFTSPGVCLSSPASPTQYSLTVTVGSPSPTLQSLFVSVPTDYTVTALTPPVAGSAVSTLPLTSTYDGEYYIAVTGLSVASGSSVTLAFSATFTGTPPAASLSDTWFVEGEAADQTAPDYADSNEPDGDDIWPAAQPTATVASGCHIVFTATGQPMSTALNGGPTAPISGVLGGAYAPPVTVQVVDGGGNPVPIVTPVTLALNSPANAALVAGTNTSPTSAVDGTASFATLSGSVPSGKSGLNLTLTASASSAPTVAASITSSLFNIYTSGAVCPSSGCSLPSISGAPGFSLSGTGTGTGPGFLAASVNPIQLSCSALKFGLYPGIPGTTTLGFSYVLGGPKTVTFFVAQSPQWTLASKLLALHYMICYTSPTPFRTVFGLYAASDPITSLALGAQYYTGLLPDCAFNGNTAPCVKSRTIVPKVGVSVVVSAPAGDPFGR